MPDLFAKYEGREVFAVWTPKASKISGQDSWLVDSNGLELLKRHIVPYDSHPLAAHLRPVTSFIAYKEYLSAFTLAVKPDRPQAGVVM